MTETPEGRGWSGQAWYTPTRPGRSGVAGQNRTGLGDLSVEGSGASGSGVQEMVQRHWLTCRHRAASRYAHLRRLQVSNTFIRHPAAAPPWRVTARRLALQRDHHMAPPATIASVVANLRNGL